MANTLFKFFNKVGKIAVIASPVIIIAAVAFYSLKSLLVTPADPTNTTAQLVEIAPGTSFRQASKTLEGLGLVKHWWTLEIISKIKRNDVISSGEYEFSPAMTPTDILNSLLQGDVYKRKVTFKEGQEIAELGSIIESAGLLSRSEFNKALQDPGLLQNAGINATSFEGYLFPETYFFSRPTKASEIILAMVAQGAKKWSAEMEERAKSMGYTKHQVLTFASIVEKESGNAKEQPIIASVFHNRLRAEWPLQSDPTAVYGLPGFKGPILKVHLENDNPYNTYKNRGLPPGPICNPGESAILSVLFPADTDYMYFVSDANGGHIFSVTQKEHERAVEFYRRQKAITLEEMEAQIANETGAVPPSDPQ